MRGAGSVLDSSGRPRYFGPYSAIVADAEDPESLYRLRLFVPDLLGDEITDWARARIPLAGGFDDTGITPRVQIGDRVWCEFEQGDLDKPVWTGFQYFTKRVPPKACCGADATAAPHKGIDATPTPLGVQQEPPNPAGPAYGQSTVLRTREKSLIEIDGTSGAERIHIFHGPTGAFFEIHPDGALVLKTQGKTYRVSEQVDVVHAKADRHVSVEGASTHRVGLDETNENLGNLTETVAGDETRTVQGNEVRTVQGNETDGIAGNRDAIIMGYEAKTIGGDKTELSANRTEVIGGTKTVQAGGAINQTAGGVVGLTSGGLMALTSGGILSLVCPGMVLQSSGLVQSLVVGGRIETCVGAVVQTQVGAVVLNLTGGWLMNLLLGQFIVQALLPDSIFLGDPSDLLYLIRDNFFDAFLLHTHTCPSGGGESAPPTGWVSTQKPTYVTKTVKAS